MLRLLIFPSICLPHFKNIFSSEFHIPFKMQLQFHTSLQAKKKKGKTKGKKRRKGSNYVILLNLHDISTRKKMHVYDFLEKVNFPFHQSKDFEHKHVLVYAIAFCLKSNSFFSWSLKIISYAVNGANQIRLEANESQII